MTIATNLKTKPALVADTSPRSPKAVREAAKLSVQQMAELMGMGLQGYQSWENGLRSPGAIARTSTRTVSTGSTPGSTG